MTWWPFRRTDRHESAASNDGTSTGHHVASSIGSDDWRHLPAIQRTFDAISPTAPLKPFADGLASHQDPRFLAPLGHLQDVEAPSGRVDGVARTVSAMGSRSRKVDFTATSEALIVPRQASATAPPAQAAPLQRSVTPDVVATSEPTAHPDPSVVEGPQVQRAVSAGSAPTQVTRAPEPSLVAETGSPAQRQQVSELPVERVLASSARVTPPLDHPAPQAALVGQPPVIQRRLPVTSSPPAVLDRGLPAPSPGELPVVAQSPNAVMVPAAAEPTVLALESPSVQRMPEDEPRPAPTTESTSHVLPLVNEALRLASRVPLTADSPAASAEAPSAARPTPSDPAVPVSMPVPVDSSRPSSPPISAVQPPLSVVSRALIDPPVPPPPTATTPAPERTAQVEPAGDQPTALEPLRELTAAAERAAATTGQAVINPGAPSMVDEPPSTAFERATVESGEPEAVRGVEAPVPSVRPLVGMETPPTTSPRPAPVTPLTPLTPALQRASDSTGTEAAQWSPPPVGQPAGRQVPLTSGGPLTLPTAASTAVPTSSAVPPAVQRVSYDIPSAPALRSVQRASLAPALSAADPAALAAMPEPTTPQPTTPQPTTPQPSRFPVTEVVREQHQNVVIRSWDSAPTDVSVPTVARSALPAGHTLQSVSRTADLDVVTPTGTAAPERPSAERTPVGAASSVRSLSLQRMFGNQTDHSAISWDAPAPRATYRRASAVPVGVPTPQPAGPPRGPLPQWPEPAGIQRAADPAADGHRGFDEQGGFTEVPLHSLVPTVQNATAMEPAATAEDAATVQTASADSAAASAAAPTAAAPSAAAPAAAHAPSAAELDEMAKRLYEPLSARLRAELWLDRERAGLVTERRR